MYNEFEFWYPFYRLKEAGAAVVTVGAGKQQYTSKVGLPAKADADVNAIAAADFDALVIPGGYAPDIMRRHPAMVKLVKDMAGARKVVAAICHAGWMLASAEILAKRRVTSFFAIKDDLIHADDCADCDRKQGMLDEIYSEIHLLGGDLDEAQRKRLIEIAQRCPVHRTLSSEIKIRTKEI